MLSSLKDCLRIFPIMDAYLVAKSGRKDPLLMRKSSCLDWWSMIAAHTFPPYERPVKVWDDWMPLGGTPDYRWNPSSMRYAPIILPAMALFLHHLYVHLEAVVHTFALPHRQTHPRPLQKGLKRSKFHFVYEGLIPKPIATLKFFSHLHANLNPKPFPVWPKYKL